MMESQGIIFDIQRFSLHDGPGIRTTVFLKGCPLRCLWCHNPESQRRQPEIAYFANRCQDCGDCINACPTGAQAWQNDRHIFERGLCQPGICSSSTFPCTVACSFDALKRTGTEQTVEEVLEVVLRDRSYFQQSNGGLTLSGGEPLAQPFFIRDLLTAARANGLHSCIETSGYASQSVLFSLVGLVDLWLFDYKATDPSNHRQLTGLSNEVILQNLAFLVEQGCAIQLRCPLVPGVNDTEAHLRGIAELTRKYPSIQAVEIMAFHATAAEKYTRYGRENLLREVPSATAEQKAALLDRLIAEGCQNARLG